ncbi:hypothetical protein [Clostridium frigidicarnis]|uniref:Uncharacterized protein n=1 Tax=Clostridium frigidicarnis TaxID=84698 RepID=A0A1I0V6C9_9CLOT|nr:hypothetical protein [Clostridium frigidicarnis]SFA71643.1 hypothetical protein SAMN04488528_1001174 [Clostridium frigidicarnis]
MEELLNQILSKLDKIERNQNTMKYDINELKGKINAVYDQTADLTEFRTSTASKLDKI